MMLYRTPTPRFTTLISNNIRHWQATIAQPDHNKYLQTERQNVYQSINMGLQVADTMPTATNLLLELSSFIEQHGYWNVWIPLLENAIAAHTDTPRRWALQIQLAFFLWKNGENKTTVSLLNELLTKPISSINRGRVHYHLGNSHFNLLHYNEAQHHAREALAVFERYPESVTGGIAPALNLMGIIKMYTGESRAAIPLFREARELWKQGEYHADVLTSLLNEGLAQSNIKEQDAALHCYQEAIPLLELLGSSLYACKTYLNLGTIYSRQGEWHKAEAAYLHVDRVALYQQGHLDCYARIITSLGMAATELGELETAVSHTTEAITIWQQLGDELMEANALENLGDTQFRSGRIMLARASYQAGISLTANYPDDLFAQQLQKNLTTRIDNLDNNNEEE